VPMRELAKTYEFWLKPMNCWIEKPFRQALCACSEKGFRLYSLYCREGKFSDTHGSEVALSTPLAECMRGVYGAYTPP
jgi:hypothetical protein